MLSDLIPMEYLLNNRGGQLIQDEHGYTYSRHKPYTSQHSDILEWRFRCSRHFRGCLCYIRVREGEIIGKYHEHSCN